MMSVKNFFLKLVAVMPVNETLVAVKPVNGCVVCSEASKWLVLRQDSKELTGLQ